jgi:thioredoxin reductase (NADPH)
MGPEVMDLFRKQAERFGTEFVWGDVVKLNLNEWPFRLHTEDTEIVTKSLIIATGASAKWIGLKSEEPWPEGLGGRGVSACATCDGFFFKDQDVFVVGGGDTAMEEANYLTRMCRSVTVVHRREAFRASKIMVDRAKANPKIGWRLNAVVDEILGMEEGKVTGIRLRSTLDGKVWDEPTTGIFVAIGHKPNSDLFHGLLDMDEQGYLLVKPGTTYTNIDGVFAAGDIADRVYRQAVTASGLGCMAAIEAERWLEAREAHQTG